MTKRFGIGLVAVVSVALPLMACGGDSSATDDDAGSDAIGTDVTPPLEGGCTPTLAPTSLAVRFANTVIARWPDPRQLSGTTPAWEYNAGIVLRGILAVYERTHDPKYLAYIKSYVDAFVDASGTINMPTAHSFDTIQPAILLPFLWKETGATKYQLAADNIRARFDTIPRNPDQGFWHKQQYPNQMWVDGIYMGEPFLSKYDAVFASCGSYCDATVVQQVTLLAQHAQAPSGLLYHAWDDTMQAAWANPTTGLSPEFWGRGDGWFAMALVDTLGDMPPSVQGRDQVLSILQKMADGLRAAQDPKTGLWYEVLDKGNLSDDWHETSSTGMFVYALKVAIAHGYIDASFQPVVDLGWAGLQTQVSSDNVGPVINGAVQGLGVQTSYAGYVGAQRLANSSHGLCAILLAASVMEAACP